MRIPSQPSISMCVAIFKVEQCSSLNNSRVVSGVLAPELKKRSKAAQTPSLSWSAPENEIDELGRTGALRGMRSATKPWRLDSLRGRSRNCDSFVSAVGTFHDQEPFLESQKYFSNKFVRQQN